MDSIQAEGETFMGDKNLQHAFLRRGSKAVGMLKIPSKYEQRYFVRPNS
jgi:hypothetical protein